MEIGFFQRGLYYLIALVISFSIHEFAHAYSAVKAGDNTPKMYGRLTLNPAAHLDPIGAIFLVIMAFIGFGIAWGKPVPVNPNNFKSPKKDDIVVSLSGIFMNFCIAFLAGLVLRFLGESIPKSAFLFFYILVNVNVWLAIFNLIPIPPLDGSHVLMHLLPYNTARAYANFVARYSMFIFLGFIFLLRTPFGLIIILPIEKLVKLFSGV